MRSVLGMEENKLTLRIRNEIQQGIQNSKNPRLAKENLEFLLKISEKTLTGETISQVMAITENVNNNSGASSAHFKKHYGFSGGKLSIEELNNILKTKYRDEMLAIMTMAFAE